MAMTDWMGPFLSGSLVSAIVAVFTLRAKVRKAEAEGEAADLCNTEKATQILLVNIVEPLKSELNEIRTQLAATEKEIIRLRKAINYANQCAYFPDCPVLFQLQNAGNGRKQDLRDPGGMDKDSKSLQ